MLLPDVDQPRIERMLAGVSRLNDAGLRDRLEYTCRELGTGVTDNDIKVIMRTRQRLAHRMKFDGSEHREYWNEYKRVLHAADRIVLRLLDYVGPYINVQTLERAVIGRVGSGTVPLEV
jgi:hypothetical protein